MRFRDGAAYIPVFISHRRCENQLPSRGRMTQDKNENPASRQRLAAQQVFGPQAAVYATSKVHIRDDSLESVERMVDAAGRLVVACGGHALPQGRELRCGLWKSLGAAHRLRAANAFLRRGLFFCAVRRVSRGASILLASGCC